MIWARTMIPETIILMMIMITMIIIIIIIIIDEKRPRRSTGRSTRARASSWTSAAALARPPGVGDFKDTVFILRMILRFFNAVMA